MDFTCKTNVYKMPSCIITGVKPLNTTYYVAFAVLSAETVDDYPWVFCAVKKLYEFLDIPDPKVIVTDVDLSIICAILEEFPLASKSCNEYKSYKEKLEFCLLLNGSFE